MEHSEHSAGDWRIRAARNSFEASAVLAQVQCGCRRQHSERSLRLKALRRCSNWTSDDSDFLQPMHFACTTITGRHNPTGPSTIMLRPLKWVWVLQIGVLGSWHSPLALNFCTFKTFAGSPESLGVRRARSGSAEAANLLGGRVACDGRDERCLHAPLARS